MRVVLVGAGGMGKAWARNLLSRSELNVVGWVDIVPGAVERAMADVPIEQCQAFTSLREALRLQPDCVVDVSVPEAHYAVTLESLAAGVPVLGEKPMAISMQQAREMVSASEASGKLYMVSQSRRYDGRLTAFRDAVLGMLGNVGILNVDFYIGAHFGGFRDVMPNVLLLDMAIHTFDQARAICGLDPVSVVAHEFNPAWSWYAEGSSATALFEMSQGAQFCYRGSWCAEGLNTSWEGDWRAIGSKGSATWHHDDIQVETVRDVTGFTASVDRHTVEKHSVAQGISGSLNEFITALQTGSAPQGECHDNIKSLAMVFGAIESAKRGERVQIAEILQN